MDSKAEIIFLLHDSRSCSSWLNLSLEYLTSSELSAELKATQGGHVAHSQLQLKDKSQSQLEKNTKHPENWSQHLSELRMQDGEAEFPGSWRPGSGIVP